MGWGTTHPAVSRAAAVLLLGVCGCAPALRYRMPSSLHSYAILVPARDTLSDQLARAFRRRGIKVERHIKGGSGPTAALVHFRFREPEAGGRDWLLVRLADTRTGVIVGEASLVVDSLTRDEVGRAEAILDSLGFRPASPS
jgi:hypothetical protein